MPDDYQHIEAAIQFIRESSLQPSINQIADHIGLSPSHFQRLFQRFAGVPPKRFFQHLTTEHKKNLLEQSLPVLETSFQADLSSPSRQHGLIINVETVTPKEYKTQINNLEIDYAIHPTPFGQCLIAITKRRICRLEFIYRENNEQAIQRLTKFWPNAKITYKSTATENLIQQIFYNGADFDNKPLTLLLHGTNFQLKVWQALLKIPEGCVISYAYLADKIGQPAASRAVGTAIGNNPISYLIPCHRVLRSDGGIGGYRWGIERKMAILGREMSKSSPVDLGCRS